MNRMVVLILPMRNGNLLKGNCKTTISTVLILPMRNGNVIISNSLLVVSIVLILPMRNGNAVTNAKINDVNAEFLSYLWGMETVDKMRILKLILKRSYPTYEEWKLSTVSPVFLTSIGSYPTYEEWKTKRRACSTSLRLIINNCYNNCCQIQNINFIFTNP